MKFMLIIITMGGGAGTGSHSSYVPFRNMEACEYARDKAEQFNKHTYGEVYAFCAYEGNPK